MKVVPGRCDHENNCFIVAGDGIGPSANYAGVEVTFAAAPEEPAEDEAPATTEAPTTTAAPTTTEAPATTEAPTTTRRAYHDRGGPRPRPTPAPTMAARPV